MKTHTISDAKYLISLYYTTKGDVNIINVSEMEDNILQDGIYIDIMLSASTFHEIPI